MKPCCELVHVFMYPDASESENPLLGSLTELKINMASARGELDKSPVNASRRIRPVQVRNT